MSDVLEDSFEYVDKYMLFTGWEVRIEKYFVEV
jgi:hypothetical protein